MSQPQIEPQTRLRLPRGDSALSQSWRHFRRSPAATAAIAVIVIVVLAAIFAPLLTHYDPITGNLAHVLRAPSAKHLFGTDQFGRDVFSRVLYGGRTALLVGIAVVAISLVTGTIWGMLAAFYGGWLDNLLMRVVDMFMAFPFLLLALMIVAGLGPGLSKAVIAVAIGYTPVYARLVRAVALGVKELDFVMAARSLGASDGQIMLRHVLPNVATSLIVQATLNMGTAIIDISGLSFLGLGAQPPAPDWGAMLAGGQNYILQAPWMVFAPGIAILIVVLAFNLVGDGLRDALDPRGMRRT